MADTSHLERMGRELKCPICLSLLNSAISLTCNHAFCNLCIEKSMKSASNCPVCKVPFRRREIRPAPHMDNLVSVYKSMEVASGVNIFITQNAPSTKFPGGHKLPAGPEVCESEEKVGTFMDTLDQENKRKLKGKGSKGSKKNSKCSSSDLKRPTFPTKKRVQVTQYPPPETPMQLAKHESEIYEATKDEPQKSVVLKNKPAINENGEPIFSPFFWLREEDDVEKTSQQTDGEHVMFTPPDVPCFSDIKDSDDEIPFQTTPRNGNCNALNGADCFDSEMFEWTQRACSPELCSSPINLQVETNDEFCGIQEKECSTNIRCETTYGEFISGNIKNKIPEIVTDNLEISLSAFSSPKAENAKSNGILHKSNKRVRKGIDNLQEKRVKGRTLKRQKKDDNTGLKEKTLRGDIVGSAETSPETSSTSPALEKPLNDGDKATGPVLPALLDQKEGIEESHGVKKRGRSSKKNVVQQQKRENATSKPQMKNNFNDTVTQSLCNNRFISKLHIDSSPAVDDKEDGDLVLKAQKSKVDEMYDPKCHKKGKSLKKVIFSTDNVFKENALDDSHHTLETISAKEIPPLGKVQGNSDANVMHDPMKTENGLPTRDGVLLRKCTTSPSITGCSFCQRTEESVASGEMVHYFKGKPVIAEYNGGSNVIHAHRNCTEWAPNVYFEGDNAINLEAELARSRRIKCCCCGIRGAALGCYEKSCRKSFHVPCAKLIPQCRWDEDNFVILCPLHASLKLPNETSGAHIKQTRKCFLKRIKPDNSKSLQWNSRGLFERSVLCCSALINGEKEIVSEFERLSGVKVLKNWDSSVTHVIVSIDENGACRRTLKFLMGVLEGKWILSIEWIKACIEAMEPVNEQHYEIDADIHGIRGGPRRGRLRLLHKEPKLFSGCKFYFTADFLPSYKGYLHDLVIAAGGAVLHRKPVSSEQEDLSKQTFIIYSVELPEKCDPGKRSSVINCRRFDAEALARSTGAVAASSSWVLNSIAACQLQNLVE